MRKLFSSGLLLFIVIILTLFTGTTVFSQKKSDVAVSKGGVKLIYNYPEGQTFTYKTNTKIVEDMDVNGQSMLVNISMNMGCEVKSAGKQGENLKLAIKIDSMAQNIDSPQGVAGGPVNDLKGKEFNIVISPKGKMIDISEASGITFTVEGSGENNLAQTFGDYFPSLPEGEIKPGDTWVTNDTVKTKAPSSSVFMPVQSNYKYDGNENINGVDCARISATLSGTRKMTTQSQGMYINVSGPFTGTEILFFAIKDGYLVKESTTSRMTGNIDIPDQNMTFPVVMTVDSGKEIVK
jgi:hypothetical protein